MPNDIEDIYPLSAMQEGIFVISHLHSSPELLVNQLGISIDGVLNQQLLKHAWKLVVRRHPILRTRFSWKNRAKPRQIVLRSVDADWLSTDLRAADSAATEQRLAELRRADRQDLSDLHSARLMRGRLCRLDNESHYFLFSFHQILFDGWSLQLIFREWFTMYAQLEREVDVELPAVRPFRGFHLVADVGQARRRSRVLAREPVRSHVANHGWLAEPGGVGPNSRP